MSTFVLVALGPTFTALTLLFLGPMNLSGNTPALRLILLADLIYVLVVAALVTSRVAQIIADRRSASAGSRLHLRLSGVFALVALVPTILVAVFAVFTLNFGLEGWFSDRVQRVVGNSLSAAQAYDAEHRQDLTEDARALAGYLDSAKRTTFFLQDDQLRPILSQGQELVQRGLREAFLIDGAGELQTRGERSYLFDFDPPGDAALAEAKENGIALIQDWSNNEFRAIVRLDAFPDRFLYVTREVDGQILSLLDDTRETVRLYHQLEADRGRMLFEFALLYLGFALILILAAVWLGLWFAERLAGPVGRLAGAAQRVGSGDLNVQIREEDGDDEIAILGRLFNQMTRQLKHQREDLEQSHAQVERRGRLFDSVLYSVTAGVMGLNAAGRIDFVNRAGRRMLDMEASDLSLDAAVPEFSALFRKLRDVGGTVQEEIRLTRKGRLENLLVRMSVRETAEGLEGYVVAFDDVTDLVSAQRMAAWGDVARRIAHEIKNPLTPIQLSAERIKRKFRPLVGDMAGDLEQYTDVIVRQTNDLRRIIDEFSRFARMPEPQRVEEDLARLVREAAVLQAGLNISVDVPEGGLHVDLDATMISQVLTNILKNAGEAIDDARKNGIIKGDGHIRLSLTTEHEAAIIRISDDGSGLPADRSRLFEPYVTTREKGTGLGLAIVKKIVEEHGGTLSLTDAPVFDGNTHAGALAEIRLPRSPRRGKKNGEGQ